MHADVQRVLPNTHISAATAYVITGHQARMRYWLECHPHFGTRLMTQCTRAHHPSEWNPPTGGIYHRYGAALYLDQGGQVRIAALNNCTDAELGEWWRIFGAGIPEAAKPQAETWFRLKTTQKE